MKTNKLPKAQENARHVVSLSSESYQLRKWRNFLEPITERSPAKTEQSKIILTLHEK